MVDPKDVPRVLSDAARLVRDGEIVVFGSAALALWLTEAPASRDVDLYITPGDRAELVEAVMGELSWYHERHDAYVEILGPETFEAPSDWRTRSKTICVSEAPDVRIVVAHPHDILVAKLSRLSESDWDHIALILREMPITSATIIQRAHRVPGADDGALAENLKRLTSWRDAHR